MKLCNTPAQVERWLCTRRARSCRPNRTRRWSSLRSRWTSPCSTAPCASAPWRLQCMRFECTSSVRLIEQGVGFLIDVLFDWFLQCKGGHLACTDCRVERPGNQRHCQKCECGGGFDVRNTLVDVVLSSMRVERPHEGCGIYVTYHKLADHQSMCPLVPCKCPVPLCTLIIFLKCDKAIFNTFGSLRGFSHVIMKVDCMEHSPKFSLNSGSYPVTNRSAR